MRPHVALGLWEESASAAAVGTGASELERRSVPFLEDASPGSASSRIDALRLDRDISASLLPRLEGRLDKRYVTLSFILCGIVRKY